jgi:myosin heavy subunit
MKALIAILILACLGLGAGLFYRHTQAEKQEQKDGETINQLSTKVSDNERKLAEQSAVNTTLEKDLTARTQQLAETSNTLVTVTANLAKVREEAQAAATNAAADIAKRDARINELETQRDDLTKRMTDLNTQINGLDSQIGDYQRKLAASEGDREYLLKELKRLQTEKNDLERQFNDLAMLREQVRKMKDELSISKRLDWIRRGLYGTLKGAERLQKGFTPAPTNHQNFDLNVELKQNGGVNVVPKSTNAPANPAQGTNAAPVVNKTNVGPHSITPLPSVPVTPAVPK